MLLKKTTSSVLTFASAIMLVNGFLTSTVFAQEPTPGYNTKIPESIMTQNNLKTRIGTFEYFDGIPTPETAAAIYNHLDYIRGVESFLNGMPAKVTGWQVCLWPDDLIIAGSGKGSSISARTPTLVHYSSVRPSRLRHNPSN